MKIQIPSLHVTILEDLSEDDNHKLPLAKLESLDEKRLQAQQRLECYQVLYLVDMCEGSLIKV